VVSKTIKEVRSQKMEKIIIHRIPSLDEEAVGRMTKDEWSKYLKFQEVLFQLQIFIFVV